MAAATALKVVLVHDWLTGMRGGEKCLEVFCRRWPEAPLYTLLHRHGAVSPSIAGRRVRTSLLQWLPGVHRYYRYLLPLMPLALRWRLPPCDLILSCSHCVAKSVLPPEGVPHVCYCFTPMRYAWHMKKAYFQAQERGWQSRALAKMLSSLRLWDRRTAERVTHFVAISRTVQRRILDCYGRTSRVIYPPVDTDFYHPAPVPREDYYLAVSAFSPYKRLDLAIAACNRLQRKLVIIGQGPEEKKLRSLAGPTIHFLGWQPDTVIRDQLRRCRALLFPGEEDFGIVPVEAQACGTPVIAFGRGGATETVVPPALSPEPTGLWFMEQTADCLAAALEELERTAGDFAPANLRRQAQRFQAQRFAAEIFDYLQDVVQGAPAARCRAA
jgi:glycosyltransferase involved in cell wall biosynthesis